MFEIYKRGQGVYVRLGTTLGLALVLLVGLNWLWNEMDTLRPSALSTPTTQPVSTTTQTALATSTTQPLGAAVQPTPAGGINWASNWLYVKAATALVAGAVGALGIFKAVNSPKLAEFQIMTESEMRKVTWPSRKAVIRSTQVIIFMTFLMAFILWGVDIGFIWFFRQINIITGGQ